jgi:hypothetical protein
MGFNKRFVTKESILRTSNERLEQLFTADGLITDMWSSKFIELYQQGKTKDEIIKQLKNA